MELFYFFGDFSLCLSLPPEIQSHFLSGILKVFLLLLLKVLIYGGDFEGFRLEIGGKL